MTGPRGYDVVALSAEFDINMHITVAGRIPLRLRHEGLTVSAEISIGSVLRRPSDFDSRATGLITNPRLGWLRRLWGQRTWLVGIAGGVRPSCVELGRSQFVQSSRLWLVVGEGLLVVWTVSLIA